MFKLIWLLSFMKLYMLLKKFKRFVLLIYDLNVILPWFVFLLLKLMFFECFMMGEILVLIIMKKSGLRFLISSVKEMFVLISLLT